jgi:biopolymer transport protein ExbD
MKLAGALQRENDDIRLNMTAMIDVVFQLLVFFILTFKLVVREGDFSVQMPLAAPETPVETMENLTTLISVRLSAADNGEIGSITVDDSVQTSQLSGPNMFRQLTDLVEGVLAGNADPSAENDVEVEFDFDYNLKYQYAVKAIGAVSGKILPDETVKTLVEKIKFRESRRE